MTFLLKNMCIFLQHESKKFSGFRYVPFHVLELRIIFYVESNRLFLGALQTCDRVLAAIVESNGDGMNITHKYSTDEGCMVAINSTNQFHANATIKQAVVSTSHEQGSVLLRNMA